jgi:hypothetical protein
MTIVDTKKWVDKRIREMERENPSLKKKYEELKQK